MRKFLMTMMLCLLTMCAAGQEQVEQNAGHGNPIKIDKSGDTILTEMKKNVIPQFKLMTYQDSLTGASMKYYLYVPKNYQAGEKLPLVMFMADASCAGTDKPIDKSLTQGWGALVWATEESQKEHPCFVLVPTYSAQSVDDNFHRSKEVDMTIRLLNNVVSRYGVDRDRLYTTGQSMGGMMSFYFNIAYPNLFAASIFVGSQWDTSKMNSFVGNKFFYIVAGGDDKASAGMKSLGEVLTANQEKYGYGSWSAKLPEDEQNELVGKLLSEGHSINFISFTKGSVLPADGTGMEHMCSFDYAYKLEAVRDWLFKQKRDTRSNDLVASLKNPNGKDVLVAAYRGDWHGTTANSINSIMKSINKGAAIAIIDTVSASKDYLRDVLSLAKGKILLMFWNPQSMLNDIKVVAEETGTTDIVLLGNTDKDDAFTCIPTLDLDAKDAKNRLATIERVRPAAVILQYKSDNNKLLPKAISQLKGKMRIGFNTTKGHAGSHDDSIRHKMDNTWGELIDKGGTVMVTNEIKPLLKWLKGTLK
ncbi:MAG: alpha/beta hydrolase-fold protein [Prevotella sp.]|jgi:predicted peptidase